MSRWFGIVVALGLLILPLASGTAAQDDVTITVWDQFTEEPANTVAQELYDAFEAANPGVTIEREAFDLETLQATARTALASGTGPDLLYFDTGPGSAGVLAEAGLLRPIDDLAEQYGWNDRIFSWALDRSTFDGQLYGLGLEAEFVGLFINDTIFELDGWKAPETFAELTAYCAAAQEAGYIPTAFTMNPGWQAYHPFSGMVSNVLGREEVLAMVGGDGGWDRPEVVQAIELFFVDLQEAGCFMPAVNGVTYDDGNALLYAGEAPMHITGTWLTGEIELNAPDYEFSMVPFPAVEGGAGRYYPASIGSAFFVGADTEHPEQVGMLLDYLFSSETAETWVTGAGFVPPVALDASGWELSPLQRFVVDALQGGAGAGGQGGEMSYFIHHFAPEQFIAVLEDGSQSVIAGEKTPEQQAADLQAAWEEGRS